MLASVHYLDDRTSDNRQQAVESPNPIRLQNNRKKQEQKLLLFLWLRGEDSNLRPGD
jgi:hypothetical protein